MSNLNNNPPRGLPGEIDQRPLVSRSSAPVRRVAAPIDEPEFELTDLAWIALKVAHCADVPVRELRWSFCGNTRSRQARTIFLLVSRELVGAKLRRLAWYVGRDEAEIEAELMLATDSEKRQAQDIAAALVIERRKASGDRIAAGISGSCEPNQTTRPADRLSNRPGTCPQHDGEVQ